MDGSVTQGFSLADQFVTSGESEGTVDLGRNFKAVARGLAGHEKELAERRRVRVEAVGAMVVYPILSEAGAILMATKGRAFE